ncbi:BTAD domain-containing putative transcriptional regulator [Streptosporangium saharense]|uniref:DNA-binding SARP family transcriptional activator n=1 Tax=Streptosporangium saharense TaxID=1706840 RepID=A0A7W7VQA0_9ACTN|nr:AfsR/SARP family transcriptional regulator [Streptosporangium saharense]MBB4918523.1 DNA-binding SARP family transcriptional activator [Streptosporangium saharense]
MINFSILGSFELRTRQGVWVPRGPKVRRLLALLLLRPGQVVDIDTLAEELWDGAPPRTVVATIRTHVYHLRQMMAKESGEPGLADLLTTEPTGYQLRVTEDQVDVRHFQRLVADGRTALVAGRTAEAAHLLREALGMWRGAPLTNVPLGPVLTRHVAHLEEKRMRAMELSVEADMRLGLHRELIPDLRGLVASNLLNEWFHARLIEALHLSGRRGEALLAFRDLRRVLHEELGLEPSAELQRLHHEILAAAG